MYTDRGSVAAPICVHTTKNFPFGITGLIFINKIVFI